MGRKFCRGKGKESNQPLLATLTERRLHQKVEGKKRKNAAGFTRTDQAAVASLRTTHTAAATAAASESGLVKETVVRLIPPD